MRINTRIVSDIESAEILERCWYEYDGPIESCDPSAIGKIANIATIGTTGAGIVGNILNSITRGKAVSKLESTENLTPEQLAAKVSGATKPLDRALIENVQNQVQADVASRGLAQAPGIFAAEESQALAPFEQENQRVALELILKQMGIPSEVLANTQGGSDPTLALMMLMLKNANKGADSDSGGLDMGALIKLLGTLPQPGTVGTTQSQLPDFLSEGPLATTPPTVGGPA